MSLVVMSYNEGDKGRGKGQRSGSRNQKVSESITATVVHTSVVVQTVESVPPPPVPSTHESLSIPPHETGVLTITEEHDNRR